MGRAERENEEALDEEEVEEEDVDANASGIRCPAGPDDGGYVRRHCAVLALERSCHRAHRAVADEAVAEQWREATRAACRRLYAGADQGTTGYLVSLMQCEDALNVALLGEADKANNKDLDP